MKNYIMRKLVIVAFMIGCVSVANSDMRENIELEIRLSTRQIRLAEAISITGKIKNVSKKSIILFNRVPLYGSTSITLFDARGRPLKDFKLAEFGIKPITQADIVSLEPSNSISMEFSAVLSEDKILDIESRDQKYAEGIFLKFSDEDSAILIPQPGSYTIRFSYGVGQRVADELSRRFGLKNLWFGKAISPPVKITIAP
jgi:hypothetical protein